MISAIKVIGGTAHPELAQDICKHLGTDLCRSTVVRFSNENLLVQIEENVREADVFIIQPSCPPVSDGIIELLMTIDALKHASAGRITAVLPYFPYVPSDKKDRPRVSITARLMADLLATAGANRILTMNLHSPQVQGFFRIPADQLQAAPILCDYLRQSRDLSNYVLVAGDVGESKDPGTSRPPERTHLSVLPSALDRSSGPTDSTDASPNPAPRSPEHPWTHLGLRTVCEQLPPSMPLVAYPCRRTLRREL
jgi:ribose-phosphate pyrophosphokinase